MIAPLQGCGNGDGGWGVIVGSIGDREGENMMRRQFLFGLLAATVLLTAAPALAQLPQAPNPVPPVPLPPPPPPPSMAVPPVPKLDAPPAPVPGPRVDRRSFNKRFSDCQSDAGATRLTIAERASYARACANQL